VAAVWAEATGWEYDLLRALPRADAGAVWRRAWARALQAAARTWWVPTTSFAALAAWASVVWWATAALGGGVWWRAAAEIPAHLALAVAFNRFVPPLVRPFVREELYEFARDRLDPYDL
jgi:hypothetical protein